jgi:hypothetical protein
MPENDLRPFQLSVPEAVLKDLRQRLSNTRFPDEPPLDPWATGTSVAYLKKLLAYWRDGFDWRAQEKKPQRCINFKFFTSIFITQHFATHPGNAASLFARPHWHSA